MVTNPDPQGTCIHQVPTKANAAVTVFLPSPELKRILLKTEVIMLIVRSFHIYSRDREMGLEYLLLHLALGD